MALNQKDNNEFDYIKVEKLPRDVLETFANELSSDWKKLARFLKISNENIDKVEHECVSTRERIYEIFNCWCKNNPEKIWIDIKFGLIFCERKDVILKCERMLTVSSIYGVQPSSKNLFTREKELCEIHQYFMESRESKKSTLVLYGMSGVGKTQIARKYCEIYHNFYNNFVWIDAAFGMLQTSLYNLCRLIGLTVQDSKGEYFSIEVIVEKIHNYYQNEKTFYIFDNVDAESIRNLGIYTSKKANSFTLITSQWRIWSNDVNQLFIGVFSCENAYVYFKNNINSDETSDENLRNLIKELGYHPFAITQAIKYINIHKISIENYIDRFRSTPLEILDIDSFPTEEEPKSAIKAINLVLLKLENAIGNPLKVLNCLSHCNGQNISKKFIIQISNNTTINEEYIIDEAIALLTSYSLLDRLDDDKYSMHVLTQLSCKCFQHKNLNTNTYLDHMEDYLKFKINEVKDHVDYGNHFVFHFLYIFRINKERMSKVFHQMTTSIQRLLTCKGLFQEAIEILKVVQCFNEENYGDTNELTLTTKNNIANCLNNMGNYNKALEIYYSVYKVQTEVFGISHLSTIETNKNIANCLNDIGKFSEALEIFNSIYKIQKEILDVKHLSTLETKNNIANCFNYLGKYNEALEIYYSVDKRQSKILGVNHPKTMITKHNIATCLEEIGKYNEALEIYYSLDKIQPEVLGINHLSTMETKTNFAIYLRMVGKYNEALEICYSLNKIQSEILGIKHPSTLRTKITIALCLHKLGKFEQALEIYYSVEQIQTEIFGINHLSTIGTKNNIANTLRDMRQYTKALEIYYSVAKVQTETLGNNHPHAIRIQNNIANCLKDMAKYNEALEIYYSVDQKQTEILGINHPSTMKTKNNIGDCLNNMGKFNEALEIYNYVYKIQSDFLGINHPDTMLTKNVISLCLKNKEASRPIILLIKNN